MSSNKQNRFGKKSKPNKTLNSHEGPCMSKIMSCTYSSIYITQKNVENDLERLEKEKVMQKVQHSDWASPNSGGPKTIEERLCGDLNVTMNPNVIHAHYPLPNAENMFASLNGRRMLSKIDLIHAYQQLEMDEASKQYLTINTHKGLYRYQRMPDGVTSAPIIFQSVVDTPLNGIPRVQ